MDFSAKNVKRTASISIAISYLYLLLRRARMYEVHRIRVNHTNHRKHRSLSSSDNCYHSSSSYEHSIISPSWTSQHPSNAAGGNKPFDEEQTIVEAKSNLPYWDKYIRVYYIFSCMWNFTMAIEYSLVCLLESGAFQNYRYLDCFLIGRIVVNPRIAGLMKYAAWCVFFFHCLHHYIMLFCKSPIRIYCLEFLLMSPSEIKKFQLHAEAMKMERDLTMSLDNTDSGRSPDVTLVDYYEYCPLLSYRNSFEHDADDDEDEAGDDDDDYYIKANFQIERQEALSLPSSSLRNLYSIRPNRTVQAWRLFSTWMIAWMGVCAGLYLLTELIIWSMGLQMLITKPGFEVNYHVCLDWIAKQDNRTHWSYIHRVPKNFSINPEVRRTFFLPMFENLVEFNSYHSIRVTWEITANIIFQTQLFVAFILYLLNSILIVVDVCYYCYQIDTKIKRIVRDYHRTESNMEQADLLAAPHLPSMPSHNFSSQPNCCNHKSDHHRDSHHKLRSSSSSSAVAYQDYRWRITDVQAMIVDLFTLIRDYNSYAVRFVLFCIFIWYAYSAICSSWLFIPSGMHEASTFESYAIQAGSTSVMLTLMGSYSVARIACAHLYKSVATIASLDHLNVVSRKRWLVIMKHYKPVPLYCFSIFRTSELSWMFTLKMIAWLFSALFITASFFFYFK